MIKKIFIVLLSFLLSLSLIAICVTVVDITKDKLDDTDPQGSITQQPSESESSSVGDELFDGIPVSVLGRKDVVTKTLSSDANTDGYLCDGLLCDITIDDITYYFVRFDLSEWEWNSFFITTLTDLEEEPYFTTYYYSVDYTNWNLLSELNGSYDVGIDWRGMSVDSTSGFINVAIYIETNASDPMSRLEDIKLCYEREPGPYLSRAAG